MSGVSEIISCICGQVQYQAAGKPIVTAVCYCADCQAAGDLFAALPAKASFRERDGGTAYVTLMDKDWTALRGEDKLEAVKLRPDAPTSRYVTTCCRTPMFIKHHPGFWVSTFRERYKNPPALEWRNKVKARKTDLPFADDIPRFNSFPLRLFGRLLKARLGFFKS